MASISKPGIVRDRSEAVVVAGGVGSTFRTIAYSSTGWGSEYTAPSPAVPTNILHFSFAPGGKHLFFQPIFSPGGGVALKQAPFSVVDGYGTQTDTLFTDTRYAVSSPDGSKIGAITNPSLNQYYLKERGYTEASGIGGSELSSVNLGTVLPAGDVQGIGFQYIDNTHVLLALDTFVAAYSLSGSSGSTQCSFRLPSGYVAKRASVSPFVQDNGKKLIAIVSTQSGSPFGSRTDFYEWDDSSAGVILSSGNLAAASSSTRIYFLSRSLLFSNAVLYSFTSGLSFTSIETGPIIPLAVDRGSTTAFGGNLSAMGYFNTGTLPKSDSDESVGAVAISLVFRNRKLDWRYVT